MNSRRLLPGLLALCLGAILARALAVSLGFNRLLLAIALGFVATNAAGIPDRLEPGIATHGLWLAGGIVLMGASISLGTVLEVGGLVLLLVVGVTATTLLAVEFLARNVFGLADRMGSLLAAGASICGVSAVVAVAGAVSAREEQIAYAAATVLLFDAITIVVYPIVGDLLNLSGMVFGTWAGVSMFSTGPVVAVGFAHSDVAGQWATMTKLARNALIGVVVLAYASYYAHTDGDGRPSVRTLWNEFPTFVLGFLALAIVSSAGVLSSAQVTSIENTYDWLFVLAFVGLGTEIRLADLRATGPMPAVVVLLALLVSSALSLAALLVLF
ncbi:putative sulfate exporter family transporter [Haloterrigena salifodinae]|uniref:Putative sulfate exporter family transporter n=1 Tax=Haloterrigena salifodinae TaxID=2675099 RepID=A0A8T8DW39_9EURY|nr:putative sulfate exporter family transporter [Haloterrigena salifodinae]QRV13779.1 putative sulfate exporter family transporter [Haloterrigena salifodinae]